jgi:hypothetical protein
MSQFLRDKVQVLSLPSISNQGGDDGNDDCDGDYDADDADDEDNSFIPSHFVTSNSFVLPPFVSFLPSRAPSSRILLKMIIRF